MQSHLHRRGAVSYTRLVVPPRLRSIIGKSDLGRSLGTKDLAEAKQLLAIWLVTAQAILAAAESTRATRVSPPPPNKVSRSTAEAGWGRAQFDYEEQLGAIQLQEAVDEADMMERADALELRLKHPNNELTPEEQAAAFLLRHIEQERDGYRRRYKRRKARDISLEERRSDNDSSAETTPLLSTKEHSAPAVTITHMFDGYARQDGSNPQTVKQFRAIIAHLISFLGHDEAKRVSHADVVRWREFLRTEQTRSGKPRTAKTINDSYLSAVSAAFSYGLNMLWVEANPVAAIAKVRVVKSAKLRDRDFNKEEQKLILRAALMPAGGKLSPERVFARRWVPWLCAYTGARVNEMTQLRRQDVTEIDGVWAIRITPEAGRVKNKEARIVPLHEHLVAQGFLSAIRDKHGPLFYNPASSLGSSDRGQYKKVGMFLAKWVRSDLCITDSDIMPNHAWRHTFKTIYQEAGIEERAADYMQGHASKGQGRKYGANTIFALASQLAKFPRFEWQD